MKNLLYILVNFNTEDYLQIFNTFLKSLYEYSNIKKFDLAIICDENSIEELEKHKLLKKFNFSLIKVDPAKELRFALLHKFDIIELENFNEYNKILYLDIDVIVQGDITRVFDKVKNIKDNTLYATKEGDLEGRFWYIDEYKKGNVQKLRDEGINSFNSGMFMFKPSDEMKTHFKNVKKFALEYYKKNGEEIAFYDQTFMNYYFNINRLSNTDFMNDIYQMFPDTNKYYPKKIILHIAGIGRYREKSKIMEKYFRFIKKTQLKKLKK